MNITIVGGGNIGMQFAVHCAEKQHNVTIYTSKAKIFDKHLSIVDGNGDVIHEGDISIITDDAKTAFSNADIIFVTVPSDVMKNVSAIILMYCNKNMKIGLIPGTGGGEWAFKECVKKGAVLFGLQRVPSVARIIEAGKKVRAVGYRKELYVAALPCDRTEEIREDISDIFDIKCIALPNYLNLTLTPSNPILHTSRLSIIFKDYREGMTYASLPLFYEDWDDESSKLLLQCDTEVQLICKNLKDIDLSYVKSLKVHYESDTPNALTKKITSIEGFKGLKTPAIQINETYIPDLHSRYFTEDFSYGLEILTQFAKLLNLETPYMNEIMQWYNKIAIQKNKFSFSDYGVASKGELLDLYRL